MKWFAKYWWLKHKYDELQKKYNELIDYVDKSFWEEITNV